VLGEHWVEQDAHAVDFDVDARVADPERAQPIGSGCGGERGLVDGEHGERRRRHAHLLARELMARVRAQVGERRRRFGDDVDEAAVVVLRVRLRSREAGARHAGAELRQREDDRADDDERDRDHGKRGESANDPARHPRSGLHGARDRGQTQICST